MLQRGVGTQKERNCCGYFCKQSITEWSQIAKSCKQGKQFGIYPKGNKKLSEVSFCLFCF